MSKSITQGMAYRQPLKKYAEKYGVSLKYNKSWSYIYFWMPTGTGQYSLWPANLSSHTYEVNTLS